jgi:hypothetical protein
MKLIFMSGLLVWHDDYHKIEKYKLSKFMYVNILDIIHRPSFLKYNVSETGSDSVLRWIKEEEGFYSGGSLRKS